ncbi:MAG TPA: endolytic transglycosylase MltG, partial [Solirubrobacteraceae bacterium]|nr:endolytic transglycosylase MltG [Solirubrobacteraceae bacterium]
KRRARELHVTPYQLLTVASMIEREAQTAGDRPKIAAVIYNRLREGIPLGIDATIYYAVEEQKGIATYTGELTDSQLKIDSPYNTRTHKGLPPTPISNPGVASIEAAAHPAHVPYLYYVAGADGCGEQVFSRTEAEFEKNVAAYDAAVKKNGGHPPACKKK